MLLFLHTPPFTHATLRLCRYAAVDVYDAAASARCFELLSRLFTAFGAIGDADVTLRHDADILRDKRHELRLRHAVDSRYVHGDTPYDAAARRRIVASVAAVF